MRLSLALDLHYLLRYFVISSITAALAQICSPHGGAETLCVTERRSETAVRKRQICDPLGIRFRRAQTGLPLSTQFDKLNQNLAETMPGASLVPTFESPGIGAVISDKCWFISIQLFSSLHLSDWWWWFQRAALLHRAAVLLFYQFIWWRLGLPSYFPCDARICVWSGDKSWLTFYLDGVKNRPSTLAPFSILTQCSSLCICPICVCVI